MDLSQYPKGPVGSPDDPLADPYDDPSYSFNFKSLEYDRQESADNTGRVRGLYSYLDDIGERHTVRYAAGAGTGFEVLNSVPDSPASVAYSTPLYKAPAGTRGRMSVQRGPDGQYKFILSGPDQRRSESSGPDGIVRGSYSYLDDKGIQRTVQYIAGAGIGYRVVQSTTGSGTHLAPRPALPEFGIRDFQSNDLADDGYLHTAEAGHFRPKDGGSDKDRGSTSRTGGSSFNKFDDEGERELYDRRKSGKGGDEGGTRKSGDGGLPVSGGRGGRPSTSGSRAGAETGSREGGYDYREKDEEYGRKPSSGGTRQPESRGKDREYEYGDRSRRPEVGDHTRRPEGGLGQQDGGRGRPESGSRDQGIGGEERGHKPGSELDRGFSRKPGSGDKSRGNGFPGSTSQYLPRDKTTSSRDRGGGAYGGEKDSESGIRDDETYRKSSDDEGRGGYRGTSEVLPTRGRPSSGGTTGSRKDIYDDFDTEFPLVTSDRKRLEIDREKDWSLRGRDSTIIKNVGRWYIGLPPGAAVRAHVQNIDLLPLNGRIPSPSEALRRDELAKN